MLLSSIEKVVTGVIFSITMLFVISLFGPSLAYATGTLTVVVTPNPVPVNIGLDFKGQETPNPGAGNQINGAVYHGSSCATFDFGTIAGHTDSSGHYDSFGALPASSAGVGSFSIIVTDAVTGAVSPCVHFSIVPASTAWDLNVAPASKTTGPGGTVLFTVSVTGTIAGNPNVMLLVSPPVLGFTYSFSVNNVPAPFNSIMSVTVAASKAPGSYSIPVWAHPSTVLFPGPGNMAAGAHVIVGSSFDFSLGLYPHSITVQQGDTANYQIFVSYSDPSYSGTNINVQLNGLGPGMNYQLVPSPPSLSIFTSPSTPLGNYLVTLTGSALGVVHQTSAVLVVQAAPSPFDFAVVRFAYAAKYQPWGEYHLFDHCKSGVGYFSERDPNCFQSYSKRYIYVVESSLGRA